MNLFELKRKNSVSIYQCVLNGNNSISAISANTGLSRLAVCDLANELVNRGILDVAKPKQDCKGRRTHYFHPSNKFYTVFIEIQSEYVCTIGISTAGKVCERFDITKSYEGKTVQDVLRDFVIPKLKNNPNYERCLGIFLITNGTDVLPREENITITTKEDLIVTAFSDKNKAILFEINGKLFVSLYAHIYVLTVDKQSLMNAIPFDEIYTYNGELYFEVYDALQRIAMNYLEKYI